MPRQCRRTRRRERSKCWTVDLQRGVLDVQWEAAGPCLSGAHVHSHRERSGVGYGQSVCDIQRVTVSKPNLGEVKLTLSVDEVKCADGIVVEICGSSPNSPLTGITDGSSPTSHHENNMAGCIISFKLSVIISGNNNSVLNMLQCLHWALLGHFIQQRAAPFQFLEKALPLP